MPFSKQSWPLYTLSLPTLGPQSSHRAGWCHLFTVAQCVSKCCHKSVKEASVYDLLQLMLLVTELDCPSVYSKNLHWQCPNDSPCVVCLGSNCNFWSKKIWIELVKNVSAKMTQLENVYVVKQKCFVETYVVWLILIVSILLLDSSLVPYVWATCAQKHSFQGLPLCYCPVVLAFSGWLR